MLLFSLLITHQLTAQEQYEVKIEDDASLVETIHFLESKFGLCFSYPSELLADYYLSKQTIECATINCLVLELFHQIPFEYEMNGNDILIRNESNYTQRNVITINGKIVDESGESIPNLHIVVDTLSLATITNENGEFTLSLPVSILSSHVNISGLGYERRSLPIVEAKDQEKITIHSKSYELPMLEVTADPSHSLFISQNLGTYQRSTTNAISSKLFGNDPIRSLQMTAGVDAFDDSDVSIRIRQSNFDETLIILDGIPLYRVDHFYGIYSSINDYFINDIHLHKNSLPVQYGGKTGGLVELSSPHLVDSFMTDLSVNLLTGTIHSVIPFSKKLTLHVAGRTSYYNAAENNTYEFADDELNFSSLGKQFNRLDNIQTSPKFTFYDTNTKIEYQDGKYQTFISAIISQDKLRNAYNSTSFRYSREEVTRNSERFNNHADWKTAGMNWSQTIELTNTFSLNSSFYYSDYQNDQNVNGALTQKTKGEELDASIFFNASRNRISDYGIKLFGLWNFENSQLTAGSEIVTHENRFQYAQENKRILNNQNKGTIWNGFASISNHSESLTILSGVRASVYSIDHQFRLSPRLLIAKQLDETFSIKGSFHIDHQFVRNLGIETRLGTELNFLVLSGEQFPIGKVENYMLGGTYKTENISADIEIYHKQLSNVMEHFLIIFGFSEENPGPRQNPRYQTLVGSGSTYGMDVGLSGNFGSHQFVVNYTLSSLKHQFEEIYRNEPFSPENDRRHQLKTGYNYNWKKWSFNGNFVFTSGKQYTQLATVPDINRENSSPRDFIRQLPSYQRLDMGIAYNTNVGSIPLILECSIFNVFNRANVKYQQYTFAFPDRNNRTLLQVFGDQTTMLPRTFNLSASLKL